MKTNRFRAVAFDLDDTLYPEQQYRLSAIRKADDYLEAVFGLRPLANYRATVPEQDFQQELRLALEKTFKTVSPAFLVQVMEAVNCHTPKISLYPDAGIALAWLTSQGLLTGLVTDQPAHLQRRKVQALGLENFIDSFVYCDDLGGPEFWKPANDPFMILALQLELEPQEIIYVGDDPTLDFIAPRRLGMGTLRIVRTQARSARAKAPSPASEAHAVISSLDMISDAIQLLDRSLPPLNCGATERAGVSTVREKES